MNGEFEYSRLTTYRNEAKLEDNLDIQDFINAVNAGEYPEKCINCYEVGIRWCKWWGGKFNCGSFEAEKSLNIIKAFFNVKRRKKK